MEKIYNTALEKPGYLEKFKISEDICFHKDSSVYQTRTVEVKISQREEYGPENKKIKDHE